ncbi:MAG: hypothetical protein KDI79_26515 [Anaerolineae bacterium]|nr:hypothetical protein [Anaerolineae bacterium]
MDILLTTAIIILSINILIVSTAWYAKAVIKPNFPGVWKHFIVDEDPYYKS